MAFSPEFLDELRARIGLVDVIGRRVRLVAKGREHLGLCPFHNEKTPSFTVNEHKGFYHCFGCGAHGTVFDFLMQADGLSFPDAVERLAADAGMQVPSDTPEERERSRRRQSLHEVTEAAASYFEKTLRMPSGKNALAYLRDRGVTDNAIARFRLGYAPASRFGLKSALGHENIPEDLMVEAGLIIAPAEDQRSTYDRFRDRVMFPITDRKGRVVGFGGRTLGDGEPKYLNSPETPIFQKGRLLYGLSLVTGAAREHGALMVVEGYMDVIALAQRGLENAVAPLGTALTEDQIQELWKIADEPVLCFDGDAAGGRAAVRAAARALPLLRSGKGLRFAELPAGDDPDSLVTREGREAISTLLSQAVPLSSFLWQTETRGRTDPTPEARAALWRRLKEHTQRITDPDMRSEFRNAFYASLWPERRSGPGQKRPPVMASAPAESPQAAATRVDPLSVAAKTLLAIMINHPDFFHEVEDDIGTLSFRDPSLDGLRQELILVLSGSSDLDVDKVKLELRNRGLSARLEGLFGDVLLRRNRFIKPEASGQEVKSAWHENFQALKEATLRAEHGTSRSTQEFSESEWEKWSARKRASLTQSGD